VIFFFCSTYNHQPDALPAFRRTPRVVKV